MPAIQMQLVMRVEVTRGFPRIHLYFLFNKHLNVIKNEN